jgi:hypothetical protein
MFLALNSPGGNAGNDLLVEEDKQKVYVDGLFSKFDLIGKAA